MKIFKKLLIMLMLMGFASTAVYADDEDYSSSTSGSIFSTKAEIGFNFFIDL